MLAPVSGVTGSAFSGVNSPPSSSSPISSPPPWPELIASSALSVSAWLPLSVNLPRKPPLAGRQRFVDVEGFRFDLRRSGGKLCRHGERERARRLLRGAPDQGGVAGQIDDGREPRRRNGLRLRRGDCRRRRGGLRFDPRRRQAPDEKNRRAHRQQRERRENEAEVAKHNRALRRAAALSRTAGVRGAQRRVLALPRP